MVQATFALSLLTLVGSAFAFQGSMTWFSPRGAMTGCTPAVPDADMAIAIPEAAWDNGAHCGKQVSITANGKTVKATVLGQSITVSLEPAIFSSATMKIRS